MLRVSVLIANIVFLNSCPLEKSISVSGRMIRNSEEGPRSVLMESSDRDTIRMGCLLASAEKLTSKVQLRNGPQMVSLPRMTTSA